MQSKFTIFNDFKEVIAILEYSKERFHTLLNCLDLREFKDPAIIQENNESNYYGQLSSFDRQRSKSHRSIFDASDFSGSCNFLNCSTHFYKPLSNLCTNVEERRNSVGNCTFKRKYISTLGDEASNKFISFNEYSKNLDNLVENISKISVPSVKDESSELTITHLTDDSDLICLEDSSDIELPNYRPDDYGSVSFGTNDSNSLSGFGDVPFDSPIKTCMHINDMGVNKSKLPDHSLKIHEKLSSREKKRSQSSIKEIEEKQARADELRQQHLIKRADKVRKSSRKVEEVRKQKVLEFTEKRTHIDKRLSAAEIKRQAELDRRILKAHDEETKGKEIAFIQSMEAEQKHYSILLKHEESRARLMELDIKRRRRLEKKAELKEAAKYRRTQLEALRKAKLDAKYAKWKALSELAANKTETLKLAAKEKDSYRTKRIAELAAQNKMNTEEMRFKINKKHLESEKRHQDALRQISRKASEMSVFPSPSMVDERCFYMSKKEKAEYQSSEDKFYVSRRSHSCGCINNMSYSYYVAEDISCIDVRPTKQGSYMPSSLKAVCTRMKNHADVFLKSSDKKQDKSKPLTVKEKKLHSIVDGIKKFFIVNEQLGIDQVNKLERSLNSLKRLLSIENSKDVEKYDKNAMTFLVNSGILLYLNSVLLSIIKHDYTMLLSSSQLYEKICTSLTNIICIICSNCDEAVNYLLNANLVSSIVQAIMMRLQFLPVFNNFDRRVVLSSSANMQHANDLYYAQLVDSECTVKLAELLSYVFERLGHIGINCDKSTYLHIEDLLAYVLKCGLTVKLSTYFDSTSNGIKLINQDQNQQGFCLHKTNFALVKLLAKLVELCCYMGVSPRFKEKVYDDSPNSVSMDARNKIQYGSFGEALNNKSMLQLIVSDTDVFGIISLIYSMSFLIHSSGLQEKGRDLSETNQQYVDLTTLFGLRIINILSVFDKRYIQSVFMDDVLCLQFRHILSYVFCRSTNGKMSSRKDKYAPVSLENGPLLKPLDSPIQQPETKSRKSSTASQKINPAFKLPTGAKRVKRKEVPKEDWTYGLASGDDVSQTSDKVSQNGAKNLENSESQAVELQLLHESVLVVGTLCCRNADMQSKLVHAGHPPTLLQWLISMSLSSASDEFSSNLLYPSLIACCYQNEVNYMILAKELEPKLLADFIELKLLEKEIHTRLEESNGDSPSLLQNRFSFEWRFPREEWSKAKDYFSTVRTV